MTLRRTLYLVLLLGLSGALDAQVVRVSQLPGVQGNGPSSSPAINDAGTLVAFVSTASSLSAGDTNGVEDIYLRNMVNNALARVSVSPTTALTNASSSAPVLFGDGATMAYSSLASNLVPADGNGVEDVFRRVNGDASTQRMSLTSAGAPLSNHSYGTTATGGNANFVLFNSLALELPGAAPNRTLAYLREIHAQVTHRLSFMADGSTPPTTVIGEALSADGRFVVLRSAAALVGGTNPNQRQQLYLRDRSTQQNILITRNATGGYAEFVLAGTSGALRNSSSSISADGRYVAFAGENGIGAGLATVGGSCTVRCIHVYDRITGTVVVIGPADQQTTRVMISADGEWLGAEVNGWNGVYSFSQVLAVHRPSELAQLLSKSPAGSPGNGFSEDPAISADGRHVAFTSRADNLLGPAADTNGFSDVFRATVDQSGVGPADVIFRHGFQQGG